MSRAERAPSGPQLARCPPGRLSLPPTPAPAAATNNPTINKGTGLGVRLPERTGWGQLLTPGAPPEAPIGGRQESGGKGKAARGRQAGMEGGTAL